MEIKAEDYMGMMQKIAWSFTKTTGLEYDDLLSSAFFAFTECQKWYDPNESRFSTYLHHACQALIIDHCNDALQWKEAFVTSEIPIRNEIDPERQLLFKETIENLPSEARMICMMIFEAPHEFLMQNTPKLSRGRIKEKLRELGWSWGKIWSGFRDIKNVLSQIEG